MVCGCAKSAANHRKMRERCSTPRSRSTAAQPSARNSRMAVSRRSCRPGPCIGTACRVGQDADPYTRALWTRGSRNRRIFPCSMSSSDRSSPAMVHRDRSLKVSTVCGQDRTVPGSAFETGVRRGAEDRGQALVIERPVSAGSRSTHPARLPQGTHDPPGRWTSRYRIHARPTLRDRCRFPTGRHLSILRTCLKGCYIRPHERTG